MRVAELAECYDKHRDALVRFAASQVGWSAADDVVSAAVVGVLRGGTGNIDDLRAYLYRSVANASAKHWRSLDRRTRRERAFQLPPSASPGADEGGVSSEILVALEALSVQQRAVVHLTYWEDLAPSVVASRLGVSDGTVRQHLARARHKLREALDG